MRIVKVIANIIAGLMVLLGAVWVLQGVNILPGSFMTGDINWAYRGAGLIVVGVIVLGLVSRMKRSS